MSLENNSRFSKRIIGNGDFRTIKKVLVYLLQKILFIILKINIRMDEITLEANLPTHDIQLLENEI